MGDKIFISYSQVDEGLAVQIEHFLTRSGVTCFRDAKDIDPGQTIESSVTKGLEECSSVVVILSPASLESQWVTFETGVARGFKKTIVPFLTHPSLKAPPYLSGVKAARTLEDLARVFRVSPPLSTTVAGSGGHKDAELMSPPDSERKFVVVVGGANTEYTFELERGFSIGQKHDVVSHALYGGSGVNYSIRLLTAGVPVLPILTLGRDDVGRQIQRAILDAATHAPRAREIASFVQSDDFFVPKLVTGRSTIIVERETRTRTILRERAEYQEGVLEGIRTRVTTILERHQPEIGFVMVGHIQADRPGPAGHGGRCTMEVVDRFAEIGCRVFLNLGSAQIDLGADFWADRLRQCSVLQLNLQEMRAFFGGSGSRMTLSEIVETLHQRKLTAVVTLDRFGAICTHHETERSVILAWPFKLENVVDPTGAGDAFGAGLVSALSRDHVLSYGHLYNAVDEARAWAAFACTKLGGANECPTAVELARFRKEHLTGSRGIEVKEKDLARDIFWMLDQT